MLNRLRDGEKGRIESWRVFVLLHGALALFHDAHDCVASLSLGFCIDKSEYLFEAFDLSICLSSVLLERFLQFRRPSGLLHFRQGREDFLFRKIDVLQRVVE